MKLNGNDQVNFFERIIISVFLRVSEINIGQ